MMNIAILGGGAVGLAIASSLALATPFTISLLTRKETAAAIRKNGLLVEMPDGRVVTLPTGRVGTLVPGEDNLEALAGCVLFVATKTYQAAEALRDLSLHERGEKTPRAIVLLQNGWGSAEEARAVVPTVIPVYSGVVFAGLSRAEAHHVIVNGVSAALPIGSLFGGSLDWLGPLAAASQNSLIPLVAEPNIEATILRKFLLNTSLNAASALTGLTYGALLSLDVARPIVLSVAGEALDVVDTAFGFREFATAASFIDDFLKPLILPRTASHRPSMAQDLEAGRKTEIDYLNGAVVTLASAHALTAPVNACLSAMIRSRSFRALPDIAS